MKFTTGSSSSSLASDSLSRKSTLCIYTDSDFLNGPEKMDANGSNSQAIQGQSGAEVAELRGELANVHRALRIQSAALARQKQKSGDLLLKLASQNAISSRHIRARDEQLTTLLHALLILEAKLKREQRQISQQLQTKNAQIYQQREHIKKLKLESFHKNSIYCRNCQNLIGSTSEQTNIETDPEFHSLDSVELHNPNNFERSLSYHEKQQQPFQKNSRLSKSFQLPKTEHRGNTSSSEEVFENGESFNSHNKGTYVKNKQAFVRKDVTRRSRKYLGRRHSSAYLDNVQKKQSSRNQISSSSAEDCPQSEKDSKFHSNEDCENYDIGEEITKDIERAQNRIDELLNASQKSDDSVHNESVQSNRQKTAQRDVSLSSKIENLHGIRKQLQNERLTPTQSNYESKTKGPADADKPWYTNSSDPEPDAECPYSVNREKLSRYKCKSADDILVVTFKDESLLNEVNSNKILSEYLPSPSISNHSMSNDKSDKKPTNMPCGQNSTHSVTSCKKESNYDSVYSNKTSAMFETNNKFDNDVSENWYASASDQDDDQSCGIYKNNPVLECVNQILLQNNLDENSNDKPQESTTSPKASTKRVQFSTLNSISFEEHVKREGLPTKTSKETVKPAERRTGNKIVKFSLDTASEHSYEVPISSEGFNYEVQSIYSNDYEPIITKPCNDSIGNTQKSKLKPVPLPRMINNINKNNEASQKLSVVKNMALNLENKINNNHYVDMETKFGHGPAVTNRRKVPRTPPALPPKPKNLVSKFKLNTTNGNALPVLTSILNSEAVELNQRANDVPNLKAKHESLCGSTKSNGTEPDYCSISEINVPVVPSGKKGLILSQTTVEIHAEQFSPNIAERRPTIIPKMATISKIAPNKISDKDIPKLPQVTEIIIPDEEDIKDTPCTPHDTYISNSTQNSGKIDNRNSIQIGHSVSTILSDIKNRNVSIEDVNKCMLLPDHNRQSYPNMFHKQTPASPEQRQIKIADKTRLDMAIFETAENESEKFDLSQNFEEFKIDDCEFTNIAMAEEYKISSSDSGSTDSATDDTCLKISTKFRDPFQIKKSEVPYKIEFTAEDDINIKKNLEAIDSTTKLALKNHSKLSNKPDLLSNIDSVETDSVRYSDIESSNSSSSNCGSFNTVKCEPTNFAKDVVVKTNQITSVIPFEYFLESSGLSSKSILTPSRPPNSNHKNVMKPKDVKMRSKNATTLGRATPLYEKCPNTAIKYFEPYL